MKRIVVLISGRGSNLLALLQTELGGRIERVICNNPSAKGLDIARSHGVAWEVVDHRNFPDREQFDQALAERIEAAQPNLIVLAGFMRILSPRFVGAFAGKILNIHPSLLPKFPGLHTHRRVLDALEPEHGATVHFVTEQLDGGPRVIQARIAVSADDDELSLAARVQTLEHRIYPLAVRWFCEDRLRFEAGQAWLDGKALSEPVQFTGADI